MRFARSIGAALLLGLPAPGISARAEEGAAEQPKRSATAPATPGRGAIGLDGSIGLIATAALAAVGVAVAVGARFRPSGAGGVLRVVGRAQLTGRHAVYLLRAGDRTLLVGVGPQGAPSLLGELDEPAPAVADRPAAAEGRPGEGA